jgi:hypothetical protein
VITFSFISSDRVAWQATGTLSGAHLAIKYNGHMSALDFVDGVYVRAP